MKELMMKKIVTYVILASFAVVLTAGEVGAKSVLPKKNRTTVSEAENSSENSKSEKIPFWGNRGSKKYGENPSRNVSENSSGSVSRNTSGSVSGNVSEASSRNVSGNKTVRVPQNNVEKPKKGNPVTEFFSNLGKKKKSKQEVELPSEKASASSSLRSVENSSGIRSYGEPVEEKPPFAPSYGVDRTTEVVSDTNEIPDAVILEDVQPEMGERPNTVVTQNENSQNFQNTRNIQNVPSAQSVSETQNVTEMQAPLATDDIIILEDVPAIDAEKGISQSMAPPVWGEETTELPPSSDPILASPDNSVGQNVSQNISQNISQNTVPNDGQGVNLGETQKTSQDILLETSQSDALDVAVTENDGILEDVEDAELPPVPSTISLPGMAPEEVSGHPEMSQNITSQNSQNSVQNALSRVQEPVYESDLDNWNQEIPTLEFMEKKNSLPLLNVSPQRLASPVGVVDETAGNTLGRRTPRTQNGSISGTQTHWNSGNSGNPADFSGNSVTLAEVKPRYGSAISEDSVRQFQDSRYNQNNLNNLNNQYSNRNNKKNGLQNGVKTERAKLEIMTQPPENLVVGGEASFTIEVRNVSESVSEGTSVEIAIPDWFTVGKVAVKRGMTSVLPSSMTPGQRCVWNLGKLLPNTTETLVLTVIPQRSASADLRISWSNQQEEVQAVTAEAPKLEMRIDSIQAVEEGEPFPLNIRVTNVGNCVARDIAIQLSTEGCVEKNYAVPGIRRLLPGEEETVQVILTPATRSKIQCNAEALIQNQRFASVENQMMVQYLNLNVEIPEIEKIYTGTEVSVPIRITNYGNSTARKVRIFLDLPSQVRVIRAEPDVMYHEPTPSQLVLEVNDIPSDKTEALTLLLQAEEEGMLELPCTIQANSRTLAKSTIPLVVEGVASMQMDLNFPTRVLTMSEFSTCEVTVRNTGTRTIEDGKLLVFFSEGIEPVQAMAFSSEMLESGVISFDVSELKPGEEHTFQFQAQVRETGNYPIRCQLKSEAAGLDLIQQKTAIYR